MYTVVAQRQLPLAPAEAWAFVSERPLLARWFADVDRFELDAPFRADFGDGDFFSGSVQEWEPGVALGLRWRFMGLGPEYDVRFSMLRRKSGTELSVVDRGALTTEEAECLRVGWSEFLMRAQKTIERQVPARFSWRKIINLVGVMGEHERRIWQVVCDPSWYRDQLSGLSASVVARTDAEMRLSVRGDGWNADTDVRLERRRIGGVNYLLMWHEGWGRLPERIGRAERRHIVESWLAGLTQLGLR
jgi:uncharacterized protein YndB with AHSA1/START domain